MFFFRFLSEKKCRSKGKKNELKSKKKGKEKKYNFLPIFLLPSRPPPSSQQLAAQLFLNPSPPFFSRFLSYLRSFNIHISYTHSLSSLSLFLKNNPPFNHTPIFQVKAILSKKGKKDLKNKYRIITL